MKILRTPEGVRQRKGKGKVVPALFVTEHQAMKEYWESEGIAPLIL
jgi:hypothetical protein